MTRGGELDEVKDVSDNCEVYMSVPVMGRRGDVSVHVLYQDDLPRDVYVHASSGNAHDAPVYDEEPRKDAIYLQQHDRNIIGRIQCTLALPSTSLLQARSHWLNRDA